MCKSEVLTAQEQKMCKNEVLTAQEPTLCEKRVMPEPRELLTEAQVRELPFLDPPKTVRIHFRKAGRLQYISHLDLQRTMGRVIARAGLPVWYTKGFNPHPKLVFGLPLPVGVESECELLDLRLDRDISLTAVRDMLNAKLTDELCVLEVTEPVERLSDISAADYTLRIVSAGVDKDTPAAVAALLTEGELTVTKKSKSGEREVDIIPMISHVSCRLDAEDGALVLSVRLASGQEDNLNPTVLVGVLRERLGLLCGDPTAEACTIVRERVYFKAPPHKKK